MNQNRACCILACSELPCSRSCRLRNRPHQLSDLSQTHAAAAVENPLFEKVRRWWQARGSVRLWLRVRYSYYRPYYSAYRPYYYGSMRRLHHRRRPITITAVLGALL